MSVLTMARRYKTRPSEFLGLDDPYTAFCFDEACTYIMNRVDEGEELYFTRKYKSFSELYKSIM